MPLDPSILLQSQPFQMTNQVDLAGKGLTLANLANTNQMGNIQLLQAQQQMKMMADPRYAQAMSQMLGGSPQGPGAPGGNADFGFVGDYPAAGQQAIEGLLKMRKEAASAQKDVADAQLATANAFNKKLEPLGNMAAAVARDPTDQDAYFRLLRQADFMGLTGYLQPPKIDADAPTKQAWANNVAASVIDPNKQVDMIATATKTPREIAKIIAETNLTNQNFALAPKKLMIEQQQANAASSNAQTARLNFQNPSPIIDETSGQVVQPTRAVGQGGQVTTSAAPITDAQGNPIQVRPTNAQGTAGKGAGEEVANMQVKAQSAAQLKVMLQELQQQDAKGMLSGGVMGTEAAKKFANVLAGMGYLSPLSNEAIQKVSNTQTFDATSQQVIADAVSQFAGSRIAARELPFFAGTKPSSTQTQQARDVLYDTLYNRAQRVQDQAAQASQYINTPDSAGKRPNDLGTFKPKFNDVTMPRSVDKMPDPAKTAVGAKLTAPDNTVYINDGKRWVRQ